MHDPPQEAGRGVIALLIVGFVLAVALAQVAD
jgi:hypothetical protein